MDPLAVTALWGVAMMLVGILAGVVASDRDSRGAAVVALVLLAAGFLVIAVAGFLYFS